MTKFFLSFFAMRSCSGARTATHIAEQAGASTITAQILDQIALCKARVSYFVFGARRQ